MTHLRIHTFYHVEFPLRGLDKNIVYPQDISEFIENVKTVQKHVPGSY